MWKNWVRSLVYKLIWRYAVIGFFLLERTYLAMFMFPFENLKK